MKIVFYANGSSGNHGCEALTHSFYQLFTVENDISFASPNIIEDQNYQQDYSIKFVPLISSLKKNKLLYLRYLLKHFFIKSDVSYYKLIYRNFVKSIKSDNIYISIGGDNYAYGKSDWLEYLNKKINDKGAKTVLWGCSIFDKIDDPILVKDLSLYSAIIARESITYEALKRIGLKSLYLLPDPAFLLERKDLPLPEGFQEGNTVGINVSPMVIGLEKEKGITLQNYIELMKYIIKNTDMQIALIPHVVWSHNDDRIPLQLLYNQFKDTGRVCLIGDHSAEELKGYIARCRFMVAARTHASIAAYSEQVPTLVVGYSVKARGIAKDLFGTDENYVIPVQGLSKVDSLVEAFLFIMKHEHSILSHYATYMSDYKSRLTQKVIMDILNVI